jgi:serine/threonine protein kinase
MPVPAGARLGPYEILGGIGAGGMGEVYRAHDTRPRRDVAIKVLPADVATDPGCRARFEQEAHAAAALNHPNATKRPLGPAVRGAVIPPAASPVGRAVATRRRGNANHPRQDDIQLGATGGNIWIAEVK